MRFRKYVPVIAVIVFVVLLQISLSAADATYYMTQITMSVYYALVVVGLCLLMGYAGQVSLGHAGFFAIGGYTSAVLTTCNLLAYRDHTLVAGCRSLGLLVELGAARWVAPIETTRAIAQSVTAARPIEAEVFAYGRLPLAFSARCFTARRYNLQKEACEYRCIGFPDGMPLRTREGEPFLTINGVQTQSALVYDLSRDIGSLKDAGVTILRVSPQSKGTVEALGALRAACDGGAVPAAALAEGYCDGFWHGKPGLERAA